MKASLDAIIAANEVAPTLEKLEADELIIDIEEKERLIEEGNRQIKELRESIMMDNLGKDLVANRVKQECWDSMEEQSIVVKGFKRRVEVPNYPLRKRTEKDWALIKKIKLMRRVEAKDFKQRKKQLQSLLPASTNLTMNSSMREFEHQLVNFSKKQLPKPKDDKEDDVQEDEDSDQLQDLLYHPFDLHTSHRKISQINLLKWIIYEKKKEFNKEIHSILELKKSEIQKIEEKNERIKEIITELKENVDIFHPLLDEDEVPSMVLVVRDDEVKAVKFMSEQERQALEARELELQQLANQKKDDSGERGLKSMMGGTLEGRLNAQSFDEELIKPEHLNKPESEMSEEELKELREFEKKFEIIEEEKEKHKKALETELKKLQGQIQEICMSFDDQLLKLQQQKMQCDQALYEEELRIIKLSQALLQEEINETTEQNLIQELAKLKQEKIKSTTRLTELKRGLDSYRSSFEQLVAEDKTMEKQVRKDFEKDYEEHFEALFKLFKKRQKISSSEGYSEVQPNDPYGELDNQKNMIDAGLDPNVDKPAGIDDFAWNRLVELRSAKIERENEIKRRQAILTDMTKYHDHLLEQDNMLGNRFEEILKQFRDFHAKRMVDASNLEVLFKLKQGQVEVEQAAVVTDYSNASLINRATIENLNSVIRSLGKEKVNLLREMKNAKKTIKKKKWENKRLDMIGEDLVEKTKYFQLLRVTKQLQELIKGGEEDLHAAELMTLERRAEHSQKVCSSRELFVTNTYFVVS
jgi:hypothetical protein